MKKKSIMLLFFIAVVSVVSARDISECGGGNRGCGSTGNPYGDHYVLVTPR